jgi:DNA-binding transcriptional regulator YiaG
MMDILYMELGFPVLLVNPRMVEVRGERVPDVNLHVLQETVFALLVVKPGRLTGAEMRFIRKHLRMRQVDLASTLNMANHSVVSQWESREDDPAGMDYNTEVLLRIWMAAKIGQGDRLLELLEQKLRNLSAADAREPLHVAMDHAA